LNDATQKSEPIEKDEDDLLSLEKICVGCLEIPSIGSSDSSERRDDTDHISLVHQHP
jgi:hypothetical protein